MEEQKQEEGSVVEENKKGKKNILKWLAIVFIIIANIVLFILKVTIENFKWGLAILIELFIVILFFGVFFATEIPKWIRSTKEEKGLETKITFQEAKELAESMILEDYFNEKGVVKDEGIEQRGKNNEQSIYYVHCIGRFANSGKFPNFFVGINMHYPEINKIVLINPTPASISHVKKRLVKGSIEESPDIEETTSENLLTGTKVTQRKVKHKVGRPKKEKEEEL